MENRFETEDFELLERTNTDFEKLVFPNLNEKELKIIISIVEIYRHIIEIDKLFHIFHFNLQSMLHYYSIMNTDRIKRNNVFNHDTSDYIAINALTINLISSGKTLTEAIETFNADKFKNNKEIYEGFKKNCLSKKYDECFQYRLLLQLRHFSQHGHLPIVIDENNRCCIDLNQLLTTPHFAHNKKLKEQMIKIRDDLESKLSDYPRINFSQSVAEFNLCIIEIYFEFLNTIEHLIQECVHNFQGLLNQRPDIINKSNDKYNGLILYRTDDDYYHFHVLFPSGNTMTMFQNIKNIVKKKLDEEKHFLEILQTSIKPGYVTKIDNW